MPRKRSRGVRRTEHQWTEILQRLRSSGLGSRQFCQSNGVPLSSLQRWQRRLGVVPPAKFVELVPPASEGVAVTSWLLEVSLPGGATLRFRS